MKSDSGYAFQDDPEIGARLERLRRDLSALRDGLDGLVSLSPAEAPAEPPPPRERQPTGRRTRPPARPTQRENEEERSAARVEGPVRAPKPDPRRPIARRRRRRPKPPPKRLRVPPPVPAGQPPRWLATPRCPEWTDRSVLVAAVLGIPVLGQMGYRLWMAIMTTSPLFGGLPTPSANFTAAAGVLGGAATVAVALVALGIVRGRIGYFVGAVAALGFFGVLPFIVYTRNAGLARFELPSLTATLAPPGWPGEGILGAISIGVVVITIVALADALGRNVIGSRRRAPVVKPRASGRRRGGG